MSKAHILFGAGCVWLGYIYAGYPLLIAAWARIRPFRAQRQAGYCPSVSVLISARNEAKDIEWKVRETLNWDYPADKLEVRVASDASDDGTDEVLHGIHDERLRYVRMESRGGKQRALNRLAEMSRGELLFFTDANTHIGSDAMRKMAEYFADSRVGCVTGVEQNVRGEEESAVAAGGRSYLDYESWVNAAEARIGSVLVCDGSIFCMRRSAFKPLHSDIANDLESPLTVGAAGYALLFDPTLRSIERSTSSPRQDFVRRRRIVAQGLLGMWRLRNYLRGRRAFQFVSRKLLRWLGLIPLAMIFVASALLIRTPLFAAVFVAGCCFLALALAGWVNDMRGKTSGNLFAIPFFFVMVNLAAIVGVVECIFGRRYSVWQQPSLSRGVTAGETTAAGAR